MHPSRYRLISSNFGCSILLAVILQVIFTPDFGPDSDQVDFDQLIDINNIHPDAKSSIRRASTSACKQELLQFAIKQLRGPGVQDNNARRNLKRSCSHDIRPPGNSSIESLGCLTLPDNFNSSSLVQIAENKLINNATLCSKFCFIYSHTHAGYNSTDHKCYCGDDRLNDLIEAPESGAGSSFGSCAKSNQLEWFYVSAGIYQPKNNYREGGKAITEPTQIRIAFLLILNGRSVLQVRRLLKLIYSKRHLYYLHVDERQQYLFNKLSPLEIEYDNIVMIKRRYSAIWGGTTLLRMIIETMKSTSRVQWDFMINLSESDLPVKPLSELEQYLASQPRSNIYLRSHNLKGYDFIKKQGLDQSFYQCENRLWRLGERQLPFDIIYSGGSDWFVLPREFCDYIIGELGTVHVEKNRLDEDPLVKPLLDLYNNTLLPAESFFHTLALNSKFCGNFVDNNLRMTNWRRKLSCKCQHRKTVDWCGCSPLTYRWSDFKRLRQTRISKEIYFARKFDPTLSSSTIEAVQHNLIDNESLLAHQSYDTRYWLNVIEFAEGLESQSERSTYVQFGLFAIQQLLGSSYAKYFHYQPESVDLYFNYDKFVGLILNYCDIGARGCLQMLVERNMSAHLKEYNVDCFKSSLHQIHLIEVNHGFDTGERVFRNFMPPDSNSDLFVYHDWTVQSSLGVISDKLSIDHEYNNYKRFEFHWVRPDNEIELVQAAKLKAPPTKPTRLILAHQFTGKKPLISGKWNLSLYKGSIKCFDYQYLIFNANTFSEKILAQIEFDKFYTVTSSCWTGAYEHKNGSSDKIHYGVLEELQKLEPCDELNWSLEARDQRLHSYDLY